MRIVRIYFAKQGEAAYISHLDLQRVMARALRRSGIPVWYSQGFNPHIYMSFSLPLPLGQESICESMDCKTESDEDLAAYVQPLNAALPRGICATGIGEPKHTASQIARAEYEIEYPGLTKEELEQAANAYRALPSAMVVRKTKRSQQPLDLKSCVEELTVLPGQSALEVTLPAGGELNVNPALLTGFLHTGLGLPQNPGRILRKRVLTANNEVFG